MTEPTNTPPEMTPPPVTPPTKIDWQATFNSVMVVLLGVAVSVQGCLTPAPQVETAPVTIEVVKPVVPAPKPTPPVVVPAKPEAWFITDASGTRIVNADLEKVAGTLPLGTHTAVGIPKPGERGTTRTITVSDASKPVVVPPVVDPVVDPPIVPVVDPPVVPITKITAVTYVYEKDSGGIPSAVMTGLNKVNRDSGYKIIASVFEDDSTNGIGEVSKQYRVALKAARDATLPALVVTAGDSVLRVVKAPTTEQQVTEASK